MKLILLYPSHISHSSRYPTLYMAVLGFMFTKPLKPHRLQTTGFLSCSFSMPIWVTGFLPHIDLTQEFRLTKPPSTGMSLIVTSVRGNEVGFILAKRLVPRRDSSYLRLRHPGENKLHGHSYPHGVGQATQLCVQENWEVVDNINDAFPPSRMYKLIGKEGIFWLFCKICLYMCVSLRL